MAILSVEFRPPIPDGTREELNQALLSGPEGKTVKKYVGPGTHDIPIPGGTPRKLEIFPRKDDGKLVGKVSMVLDDPKRTGKVDRVVDDTLDQRTWQQQGVMQVLIDEENPFSAQMHEGQIHVVFIYQP